MADTDFLAEDRSHSIIVPASLMIILSTLFVVLRLYSRYLTSTSLSVQDVIVPFAWLAEVGLCVTGIFMVEKADTGRHVAYVVTIDPAEITEHFKGIMLMELIYPAAVAFPKLLVVLLYLNILTHKYERIAAKSLFFLISATWLSFTLAAIFKCTPFAFNWDKTIGNGKCFNLQIYENSSSVPNIFTGLAVLVLPLRTVWGLKICVGRRVGLLLIFLIGTGGIIASIFRTVVFAKTLAEAGPLVDVTWHHVALVRWTIIEPGMYLLSACAISFKPLFRMFAKALHLQAFITHTKSAFQAGKSHTKKTRTSTHTDLQTQNLHNPDVGKFYRLGGDIDRSSRKTEVLVMKEVDIEMDFGFERDSESDRMERPSVVKETV